MPDLLTLNGGYVDAAGFIALHELFTAHVTGNFVTIGAALVNGTAGIVGKLLVLPVFCLVVVLARLAIQYQTRRGTNVVPLQLLVMALLLAAAATAIAVGPFVQDSLGEIATGMALVAAMAIQSVLHRVHFPKSPPTTLMTGSTTLAMMDIADLLHGGKSPAERATAKERCVTLARSVGIFALGCTLAALLCTTLGMLAFAVPPLLALLALLPAFRRTLEGRRP